MIKASVTEGPYAAT